MTDDILLFRNIFIPDSIFLRKTGHLLSHSSYWNFLEARELTKPTAGSGPLPRSCWFLGMRNENFLVSSSSSYSYSSLFLSFWNYIKFECNLSSLFLFFCFPCLNSSSNPKLQRLLLICLIILIHGPLTFIQMIQVCIQGCAKIYTENVITNDDLCPRVLNLFVAPSDMRRYPLAHPTWHSPSAFDLE